MMASAIQVIPLICADSNDPQIRYGAGIGAAFLVLGRPLVYLRKLAYI